MVSEVATNVTLARASNTEPGKRCAFSAGTASTGPVIRFSTITPALHNRVARRCRRWQFS